MSTSTATTAAQLELIDSLNQDEIPIKLRCAICSKLAVNAFRLPCCDQIICETCQSALPSSCPVCEHTPVSADDCKPNKALRTTIKIFLRTEEKKREALRAKEAKAWPPAAALEADPTPVEPTPTAEPVVEASQETSAVAAVKEPAEDEVAAPLSAVDDGNPDQAQEDVPQQSIEEIAPGQEATAEGDAQQAEEGIDEKEDKDVTETGADGEKPAGFGFDSVTAGGFPMGFGGEMNAMQQMMMIQNGMGGAAFGNFPMMGMPSMNMDPMTMQNMFMNGGFGAAGMGMGGMPMGMGMGGFDGGMGTGFNNGWNGQQSWSNDNSFNPNAAGMGPGDYGANNFGNASHANGYNQGNGYGRGNHYNDYQNNFGSGYRGRGRGRGGYGRGGYGHGSNEAFSQQLPQQFGSGHQAIGASSDAGAVPTGPKADSNSGGPATDEFGREIRQTSEEQEDTKEKTANEGDQAEHPDGEKSFDNGASVGAEDQADFNRGEAQITGNDASTMAIQTFEEPEAAYQNSGPNGYNNGYNSGFSGRGGFGHFHGGQGGFGAMQPPVKPVHVPINAPKGPKAMREGLPNTSLANLRGRGFSLAARPSSRHMDSGGASANVVLETSEKDNRDRDRNVESAAAGEKKATIDTMKLVTRFKTRRALISEQDQLHRQIRNDRGIVVVETRTNTESVIGKVIGSIDHLTSIAQVAAHIVTIGLEAGIVNGNIAIATVVMNQKKKPSIIANGFNGIEIKGASARNKSISEEIKIPTGPRKDRISSSNKEREKDRSSANRHRHEDTSHRSSHHRESERSSGRDKDREREREKPRGKEETKPPTAPAGQDPHTMEREARNRERLLKEAQRMAGMSGGQARKRSRDDVEDASSRKGRKKGRRGGTLAGDDEEERLAKMEAEREGARWA
ncbi:hypothetical protein BJ875DRAFT_533101 [Amylocarpus encephaloides]|uniref:RING-type domain-containing protein n=1 Tax=Amylocarpus encephaloides TaxID=45428 RepID=A0A9P8C9I2_9HELO|nr:hypothetical protein BJ875DRAFT_533101 [Amylocarpus encephaloides]